MRHLVAALALVAFFSQSARAADGLSGAWSSGTGAGSRTYVFKVRGDRFDGIMCGPCDDPSTVFRIEDGKMLDPVRVSFSIADGSHRVEIGGTRSGSQLTLQARREGGSGAPVTTVIKRVIENYPGLALASSSSTVRPNGGAEKVAPFEGKWVAAGRNTQQNFILKVRDNRVWGLVCGPCRPDGVFMIDDGTVEGNNVTFYINHIDTPPSDRTGLSRNIMRGTLVDNVMKFKWVREGAENEPGGEMVLIGPLR